MNSAISLCLPFLLSLSLISLSLKSTQKEFLSYLFGPRGTREAHQPGQLPVLPAAHAEQEAHHVRLLPLPQLLDVLSSVFEVFFFRLER